MVIDESSSWHSTGISYAVSEMEPALNFPEFVSLVLDVLRISDKYTDIFFCGFV